MRIGGHLLAPREAPEAQKTPEAHVDSIQGIILFSALTAKRRRPGTPQGAAGGDFDSFWGASRTSRGPKKGVRKMDRKMDPRKIDFWRVSDRDRAGGGGVCGGVAMLVASPMIHTMKALRRWERAVRREI